MDMKIILNLKDEKNYNIFLEKLFLERDLKYREFHSKIVVTEKEKLIGVRVPILKKIAKEISKNSPENYLNIFQKLNTENKIKFYEEKLIYSFVVSYFKESFSDKIKKIDTVISLIDNWALCDSFISSAKFINKDKEDYFNFISSKIYSKNSWELRFVLVSLLSYYIEEFHIKEIFEIILKIKSDDYYVKMAKAWLLSVCYIKFKNETIDFLKNSNLDAWTLNKSIQKIRESDRVSSSDKEKIILLKK